MREAVFGGDLFWSNLPYEVLNFYEYCLEKKITPVGLMTIPDINSEPKTVFILS